MITEVMLDVIGKIRTTRLMPDEIWEIVRDRLTPAELHRELKRIGFYRLAVRRYGVVVRGWGWGPTSEVVTDAMREAMLRGEQQPQRDRKLRKEHTRKPRSGERRPRPNGQRGPRGPYRPKDRSADANIVLDRDLWAMTKHQHASWWVVPRKKWGAGRRSRSLFDKFQTSGLKRATTTRFKRGWETLDGSPTREAIERILASLDYETL